MAKVLRFFLLSYFVTLLELSAIEKFSYTEIICMLFLFITNTASMSDTRVHVGKQHFHFFTAYETLFLKAKCIHVLCVFVPF